MVEALPCESISKVLSPQITWGPSASDLTFLSQLPCVQSGANFALLEGLGGFWTMNVGHIISPKKRFCSMINLYISYLMFDTYQT